MEIFSVSLLLDAATKHTTTRHPSWGYVISLLFSYRHPLWVFSFSIRLWLILRHPFILLWASIFMPFRGASSRFTFSMWHSTRDIQALWHFLSPQCNCCSSNNLILIILFVGLFALIFNFSFLSVPTNLSANKAIRTGWHIAIHCRIFFQKNCKKMRYILLQCR